MESAEARDVRQGIAREKITLAVFSGFVGIILGLLTPVYVFGQRLAVQEVQMASVIEGVKKLDTKLETTTKEMSSLRESLAQKGIRIQKGE